MANPAAPQGRPASRSLSRKTKIRIWTYGLLLVTIPILLFALYVYVRLNWSYSDGDRSGTLQKFSRKGWVCKSFEGELSMPATAPGMPPQIWDFSVRDPDVAKQLNAALGHRVVLHYAQHPDIPTTCFGETEYFVDGVRITD